MEIKSRQSLPLEKRSKASKEELLRALEEAEGQLEQLVRSPYYDTYITLFEQITDWNDQLKIKEARTELNSEGIQITLQAGKIDLFADKDSKEFERAFKYFSEVTTMLDALDNIRKRMTPQEIKQIESTSEFDDAREVVKSQLNGRKH